MLSANTNQERSQEPKFPYTLIRLCVVWFWSMNNLFSIIAFKKIHAWIAFLYPKNTILSTPSQRNVQANSAAHRSHKPQHQRDQDSGLSLPRRRTSRPAARRFRLLRRKRCPQRPDPVPNHNPPRFPIKRFSAHLDMDRHRVFRSHVTCVVEACRLESTCAV